MSSKFKNLWSRRRKDPPEIDEPAVDQEKLAPPLSSAESSGLRRKDPPKIDEPTIKQEKLAPALSSPKNHGLVLLYDGADPDHPDVDFVAVHGIGGHSLKTFTDAESGCCWLRDLLPLSFPRCRVFSYGYPADIFTNIPTSLADQAKELRWALGVDSRKQATVRRRIFICHSTGGLVVKRVLIVASLDMYFVDVFKYASGILFFGTPHRGSPSADSALILAKMMRVIPGLPRVNQSLLRDLKRDSTQMDETNEMFNRVGAASMSIGSFYET